MLSVSNLVRVTVNLSPLAAARRSFGVLMVAGDSNIISGLERFRTYLDIDGVAADFGTTAPEYKAAALYFGQSPKPQTLMIGRWLRTATAGANEGGILSPSEQLLSRFTGISSGGMVIVVDGVTKTLTGLDFTGVLNLNGVASVINGALTGAVVTWDGSEFVVTSDSTGAGAYASGTITLDTNPAPADTLTVNGTAITFVASGPTGPQVLIGSTNIDTAANLQTFLAASVDSNIDQATYATVSNVVTATFKVLGLAGNSFTLTKSSSHITLSGATLAGGAVPSSVSYATTGSGTDISVLLKLTSSLSQALITGYNAETPVECAAVMANKSAAWYGLMFQASVQPTDQQNLDVSTFIEAQTLTRIFGVTITNTNVLSDVVSNDLASVMMGAGYKQSFCQYSQNPYAIASMFGRAFSVDFNANRSTITLMYKQEPGVTGEDLDQNQSATLKAKRL